MGRTTGNGIFKAGLAGVAAAFGVACSHGGTSYSILPVTQSFKQAKVNSKIDVLWVVDNSPSMQPLQQNMTSNFNSFIQNFVSKGYDFHIAVTSTEAYLAASAFHNEPGMAIFSNGVAPNLSGVFDILSTTQNLIQTFVLNASLGANGSGDERALSSMKAALDSQDNAGFLRQNSYFAAIILSDEDDFSDSSRPEYSWAVFGGTPDHNYSTPTLDPVSNYVSYLAGLTGSTATQSHFSVNAIAVLDTACQLAHSPDSPVTIVGQRYIDLANQTNGVLGSICDASFANAMSAIQSNIIELGTQFYLDNEPIPSSIVVIVNGTTIPQDPSNGWTYNADSNSVIFHGTAVPDAGAAVYVGFDPVKLQF